MKESNYKSRALKAKTKEKPMSIDMTEHSKTHSVPKVMRRK